MIFHFHKSPRFSLGTSGRRRGKTGGGRVRHLFPNRPNPVGMSISEVPGVRGVNVDARRLDVLDGTPTLDIKRHIEDGRG